MQDPCKAQNPFVREIAHETGFAEEVKEFFGNGRFVQGSK